MSSIKNKHNRWNNHRHVFKRRWHAEKYQQKASLKCTSTQGSVTMQGSRIINLDNLQEYINRLTVHAARCEGNIVLTGETRAGLASIISSHCSKRSYTVSLETSRRVKGPKGNHRWEHNLAAVWGQLVVVIHVFRRQWVYLEFPSCQQKTSCNRVIIWTTCMC